MKNCFKIFGIIAVAAVITIGLAGCNTLQSIEVTKEPAQTVYGQGQELNRAGLVVMGHFKKDSRNINENELRISYDKGRPGEQMVTVTWREKTATFRVTVVPVERVSIERPPVTTAFRQGNDFNSSGLLVRVEFANETVPGETVGPDRLRITGYNKNEAGVQTLTVDYYGKRASFDVRVAAITAITVVNPPDNTTYFTGEDLDLAGLVVNGVWEGAGEEPVKIGRENLSSFDKNRAGRQDVFVTYQGKTASFPVTYVAMQAIQVAKPPDKLNYENGERLDINGLSVQGTRQGATSIEMLDNSRLQITGYDRFKAGNQTITVTLGGRSANFRVTVAPSPFIGTWYGTRKDSDVVLHSVTLTMSENAWSMIWQSTGYPDYPMGEYSGTYTRDTDTGKSAQLKSEKRSGINTNPPASAEILSSTELKLIGGGLNGLILTKQ